MTIKTNLKEKVKSSEDVYKIMKNVYKEVGDEDKHKELFYVIGMNSQNTIKIIELISLGTINQATPYIREIAKIALLKDCVSIILCHNHPSGNFNPSPEDKTFTEKAIEGLKILNIKILDHLILTKNNYFSFSDENLIY